MRRLAGCLVVCVIASAAAWAGCRDVVEDDRRLQAGTGTDAIDAMVVIDVLVGSGSDGGIGSGSDGGVGSGSDGGIGSGSDGGIGSGSDGGVGSGSGSDGGTGSGSGAGSDAGTGSGSGSGSDGETGSGSGSDAGPGDSDAGVGDAGLPGPPSGFPDARPIFETGELDRTSFYACAGGGAATGVSVGLPLVVVAGFAVRRRRRTPR